MGIVRLVLAMCLFPALALGAPSVSTVSDDTPVDGQIITISGADFGAKASPAPLVFETFENGTNGTIIRGNNCSNYGAWSSSASDVDATYTNTNQRQGSTLSSYTHLIAGSSTNNGGMWVPLDSTHCNKLMLTFWYRYVFDAHLDGDETGMWQHKIMRVTDGSGMELDSSAHIQLGWHNNNDGLGYHPGVFMIFHNDITNPSWGSDNTTLDVDNFNQYGVWQQIIMMFDDTGKANIYVNGARETTDADLDMTTWIPGDEWKSLTFSWYLGTESWLGSTPELWDYYDDIYADRSWKTVWIGDASTWDACTAREIQVQTSRTDTSISITVNQGGLSGDAWIYVMDEDGAVNSTGKLITFGGAQSPISHNAAGAGTTMSCSAGTVLTGGN